MLHYLLEYWWEYHEKIVKWQDDIYFHIIITIESITNDFVTKKTDPERIREKIVKSNGAKSETEIVILNVDFDHEGVLGPKDSNV